MLPVKQISPNGLVRKPDCAAALLNNPDDSFLLACGREAGHTGDHFNPDTGFAWHPNCTYQPHMLWGSRGEGWVILTDDDLATLYTLVLENPTGWAVERVGLEWKFRQERLFSEYGYNLYRGNGFQIDLLAAAWCYAMDHA